MSVAATQVRVVDGAPVEYRLVPGDPERSVVLLPGAHMNAGCPLREASYTSGGRSVLIVSRPGYGRTARAAGPTLTAFAGRVARLAGELGFRDLVAAGISLGARTALVLAARHPDVVRRVVLSCPVSFLTWPDRRARLLGRVMFGPGRHLTWRLLRRGLRDRPDRLLPLVLAGLTTLPVEQAIARLGEDRSAALEFLASCSSDRGSAPDLAEPAATDLAAVAGGIGQPVLIIATRTDGSVRFGHAEHLAATLPDAQLVEVGAATHLLWLGDAAPVYAAAVAGFVR